jgi:hypothetical protein
MQLRYRAGRFDSTRPGVSSDTLGVVSNGSPSVREALMTFDPDDLSAVVGYALHSTRATAICPFHLDVRVRVGDDAAESHAWARARNIIKTDGTKWEVETLREEFNQQLGRAADGLCPRCAHDHQIDPRQW